MSLLPVWEAEATHLRAGQITVRRLNCLTRLYEITVTVYTDTGSPVLFGGEQDILNFGDGTSMLVPETANTPVPGGNQIGTASFTVQHTYAGPGRFTISYLEPNRNEGVLNIENSVLTTFYIETQIDLSVLGCDNSPVLLIPPIDQACRGVAFFHNPGAYDPDGDSLSFHLVVPFRDRNVPVTNYRDPNHPGFYDGLDYDLANEAGTGPPTFAIDSISGTITWDAPGKIGEYNVAFVIREWREINGVWTEIGFVRRDMQIIVADDCINERPRLEIPKDTCVVAGTTINATILGFDDKPNPILPDNHNVKIEAFSEIFAASFNSPATYTPNPPAIQSSNPSAELQFQWNTECGHVKDQEYLVVFKITDYPPQGDGPSLVEFKTWRIKVVAPAPVLQTQTVDHGKRHATITWAPYDCFQEASAIQIWRRVDDTNFTPDDCDTGMPESLGFELIDERPIKNGASPVTTYTDTNKGKGLAVGGKYCYRLVAIFPQPRGGESIVSNEICIEPILVTAPAITHVTVDKTGETDGEVTVRWTRPFAINLVQFPGPKEYLLQRATGTDFVDVSNPRLDEMDTSYTETGLNTRDTQYFYRVILYSGTLASPSTMQPVDTSSLASSVWLDLHAQKRRIDLNWSAEVPWSNQLQSFPMHHIFRGDEGATEFDLILLDSVDVTLEGFTYPDTGKLAPGDSLNGNNYYCYRVMTRGGYGNPNVIREPLINYSQINCAKPTDDVKPCQPVLAEFEPCKDFMNEYGCDATNFSNTVRWYNPPGACADDVRYYNVYAATVENGTYNLIATNVRDTFYVHSNLASLAYCYRVVAVDRSNNESDPSDPQCNNNCPYYELPNVFSPNGDGCNDIFSAFGVDLNLGENPVCDMSAKNVTDCARFVQRVDFTVYNRWGGQVYHYIGQQGNENTIYINWDGRDEKGRELATGTYYYVAEVTYDVIDPTQKIKKVKGWVDLRR